jgi:hypothetical protein
MKSRQVSGVPPLCIGVFRFRLGRQSGFLPRFPPADEGAGLRPARPLECLRHTGASIFIGSGTVGDKPSRVREANFCRLGSSPAGRHTHGAPGPQRTRSVSLL